MKSKLACITLFALMSCNTKSENASNGLITKESSYDFDTTYNNLRTIIDSNPNLKILLELDHSKNAASVDLKLNQTKIILFGNPKLGTPLMQSNQTTSIDLPQKIIVFSDEKGNTNITYNDPFYLKQRHGINDKDEVLEKISNALRKITDKASGNN